MFLNLFDQLIKKKTQITPGLTLKDKLGDVAGAGSLVVKNKS